MQAAAVAKLMTNTPAGAAQGAGAANDAATADGADFAALMAAQIQLGEGVALPAAGVDAGDVAALPVPVAGDAAANDLKPDVVPDAQAAAPVDPALQAMALLPAFAPSVPAMQQVAPGVKVDASALSSERSAGDRMVSALRNPADGGSPSISDKLPVPTKEGAAEFAVDGKSLPSGDMNGGEVKVAETFKLPDLPVEAQRAPDAVPVVMNGNPARDVGEIKASVATVQQPVGTSGWGDALGQRVVWMAGQHQQVAELHLNPPHLGPMEVRLTINNDQVSALFVSHQPAVREAIEAAMPRLREMFADSGMMLGNAMVSSDSLPQQQNSAQEGRSGTSQSRAEFALVDGYSLPVTARGVTLLNSDGRGLVDLFA